MSPKEFVDTTIANNSVVIFSKSYCPYCRKVKALFKEKFPNVTPFVVELDERGDGSEIQKCLEDTTGQRTVPNVFVKKQHIGGSDDTKESFDRGDLGKLLE